MTCWSASTRPAPSWSRASPKAGRSPTTGSPTPSRCATRNSPTARPSPPRTPPSRSCASATTRARSGATATRIIDTAEAADDRTLVVKLKTAVRAVPVDARHARRLDHLQGRRSRRMGAEAYAESPIASGAFTVKEWRRGDKVVLEKNPNFWEADRVKLDGVEWISVPDDNTRMLKVQAGELDAAIFVPFSRIAELKKDPNLNVQLDPSTREDHLLINHEHGALAQEGGPPGARHGDRQAGDRRHRHLRRRRGRQFLRPEGCALPLRRQPAAAPTIRPRPRRCWRRPAPPT